MKKCILIFLVLFVSVIYYGCEQPTETKATDIPIPHLSSPYNGSTNISLAPLFKWNNNAQRFQLALFRSFNSVIYSADINGTTYQMPHGVLQNFTSYYWRVGVVSGNNVYWSAEIFLFSTGDSY